MSGIGHNSGKTVKIVTDVGAVSADQLKSIVERIERLNEDKKAISDDIREMFGEAKANGFDVKIVRKLIALRKKPQAEREEEAAILELYCDALGVFA